MPIIGWLAWQRAPHLAPLVPHGWLPGLAWPAAGAILWLLGEAAGVALFRQAGLVVMLQGLVPALLGPQVTRALLFPLFFALFLIPAGEELVPPMQHVTAQMAMAFLRLAGIPAHLDGIFISTPVGYFVVAEACSGVKFLIAMAALASLVAHLCFRAWKRRIAFLVFAMIVPVIANGLRAFGTIWMAEQWGMEAAAGADHLIYGWIFFGLVMALVGLVASRWFDRSVDDPPFDSMGFASAAQGRTARPMVMLPLLAAVAVAAPLWLARDSAGSGQGIAQPAVPEVNGWAVEQGPARDGWRARFDGATAQRDVTLVRGNARVEVALATFASQREGAELVGFGQGAVDPDSDWRWSDTLPPVDGVPVDRLILPGIGQRDAMTLYRIGGETTASPRRVKWLTLLARLTRGNDGGFAIILSAQSRPGLAGRAQISALLRDAGGADALVRRLTPQP